MSGILLAPSACPVCGVEDAGVYLRSPDVDDLVCQPCRDSEPTE